MSVATSPRTARTAKPAAKVTTVRQPAKGKGKPAPVIVSEPTWADVDALVTMATGAAAIAAEQGLLAEQAQRAHDNARALKVRAVWLVAAHPDGKGKPLNASYAARMTGFPRTTVNDLLKAGQNSIDRKVVDLSDMLAPVSDKERDVVNTFYANGIAAKRREERAAAKLAKGAKESKGEAGTGEGDDQSSAGKSDGITGALVVDGLKLAANRVAELKRSKVTMSKKDMTEAAAYVARMVAWIEEAQADSAAAAE